MSDEVRLIIEGKELAGWEGCSIEMAVDQIADVVSVDGPWDPDRADLRSAFRPFGFQPLQLYIDDDLYITGLVDKVKPSLSAENRKINIQGSSLTGQLVDCSVKGDLEFSGMTLAQIARRLCAPFGIKIRADTDTEVIPEARSEYGQGVADFLNSLAAPRNILLNSSYAGELVLTSGASLIGKTPVARLVEGEWPVESVDADYDATKRFSLYQVATQFAGLPDIVDSAYDSGVPIYRPHLQAAQDAVASPEDSGAQAALDLDEEAANGQSAAQAAAKVKKARAAARLRAEAFSNSCPISVTVDGWRRPDGKRWAERQIVTLLAPSAMIYKEVSWLIAGVMLKLDVGGGYSTTMRLVLPETYSGTMPKVIPWA
jgi:prophage tail gpP-like protein